jgi:putative ABC transport system permease protein
MSFLRLIILNLRRHSVRTAIGAVGIAFGVATMLCVVTVLGGAIRMFERILSTDSELIVFERNVSDLFFSNVPEEAVIDFESLDYVDRVEPVLFGVVSSEDNPVITCFGLREDSSRLAEAEWIAGKPEDFRADGEGIVVGERAADFMKATVGTRVPIGREEFEVVGVIRTANGFEDGGVFMPLALSQTFFGKEGVSSVSLVKLGKEEDRGRFKEYVTANHPNLTALENEEFSQSYSQFQILKTTGWVVGGCSFLLGGLSVANTMIMAVFGRIRELAILRVCGFSRWQVARIIVGESVLVALLGVAVGLLLSRLALGLLKSLSFLQGYVDPRLDPGVVLVVVTLAVVTGVLGALYPALYAMRVKPAKALRFE